MSQEAYRALHNDLVEGQKAATDLQRRLREIRAQENRLEEEREQSQAAGQHVPSLYEEQRHVALQAERSAILAELHEHLQRPRLSKAEMASLKARLSSEERARLRQEMLHQLQRSPPDMKLALISDMDEAMQTFRQRHGSTPEAEADLDKARRLQEEIMEHDREADHGHGRKRPS